MSDIDDILRAYNSLYDDHRPPLVTRHVQQGDRDWPSELTNQNPRQYDLLPPDWWLRTVLPYLNAYEHLPEPTRLDPRQGAEDDTTHDVAITPNVLSLRRQSLPDIMQDPYEMDHLRQWAEHMRRIRGSF